MHKEGREGDKEYKHIANMWARSSHPGERNSYNEIDQMRAEEKNTKQKLVRLKDEALNVIGELVVFQSMVKKVAQDSEQKIPTLTT